MTAPDKGALTVTIEKAVVGGHMLARHDHRVLLVDGGIPGERVRVRISRTARGVAYAEILEVLDPSPDRREPSGDVRCGGRTFAHIALGRQRQLKAEIVTDALSRLGAKALDSPPDVVPSPDVGYRLRARLHVDGHRLGFFREHSYDVCDARHTGQFLPATCAWLSDVEALVASWPNETIRSLAFAEDIPGLERVAHIELGPKGTEQVADRVFGCGGLLGVSVAASDQSELWHAGPSVTVDDTLPVTTAWGVTPVRVSRNVRAFFQGNRFLVGTLVDHVVSLVQDGPVLDLFSGVGVFGLAAAAAGAPAVTLVESDPISSGDLRNNAARLGSLTRVVQTSVEAFLARGTRKAFVTVILDPPRTGLSRLATEGVLALAPHDIVYVSCDPATFARDTRRLAVGYALEQVTAFDLFPHTAHIETVARLTRR